MNHESEPAVSYDHAIESRRKLLTPTQSATLRRLYGAFQMAQANLNEFTRYLMEEHRVPDDGSWEIDADLREFVEKADTDR